VVLVASDGSTAGWLIEQVQRLSLTQATRAAARFTHAAVYVGDGMVIDARPGEPISRRSVWQYCEQRELLLRRLPSRSIPLQHVLAIAEAAQRHLGEPYSIIEAVLALMRRDSEPDPERLYCSTFVGLVVTEATDFRLTERREHRPLTPARLAIHPELETVATAWCPVAVAPVR